jgi:hypothetical protein
VSVRAVLGLVVLGILIISVPASVALIGENFFEGIGTILGEWTDGD